MKSQNKIKHSKEITSELKNKTILITGGAGSIGIALAEKLLEFPIKSLRVLDINEHSLFLLGRRIKNPKLRLLLGSINDKERLEISINDADIVIHTAALKNLEITEFNPIETIETNINGVVNLIKASTKSSVKKIINISTDKSVEPTTLYGTTKLLGEVLVRWAGNHISKTKFGTVRLGNIFESNGNVFEIWNEEKRNHKPLSITDPNMERYFFHIDEAVDFILKCIPLIDKGEVYIPKMKSYKIKDLATKISTKHKIIGKRSGEKLEEKLLSEQEKQIVLEKKDMWIIK